MLFKRDEKYHQRDRHLYALIFNRSNAVYIGQTVSLARRQGEHQAVAGGWPCSFEFLHLSTIRGTKEEAEDHERAWRYVAASQGHRIYAKPPGIVVNCRRNQTRQSLQIAKKLHWPRSKTGVWARLAKLFL
ncbi:GIY-YIG nuclease family protein [Xanthomonas axonopodis]